MVKEPLVLDRDHGLDHMAGQFVIAHHTRMNRAAPAHDLPVARHHGDARRARGNSELVEARQVLGDVVEPGTRCGEPMTAKNMATLATQPRTTAGRAACAALCVRSGAPLRAGDARLARIWSEDGPWPALLAAPLLATPLATPLAAPFDAAPRSAVRSGRLPELFCGDVMCAAPQTLGPLARLQPCRRARGNLKPTPGPASGRLA